MKPTQRVILQVPMKKELKLAAEKVAEESGFSSLQDAIRMFLNKFSQNNFTVSFEQREERLSPKAEKRYAKIVERIKSGKEKTIGFSNVDDMMAYLNS